MALSKIGTDGIDTAATPTVASATVTGDLTVDTNTLYVDSTNNRVGIGVTPERQLHIEGNGAEFSLVDTQRTSGSRTANMFIDASDRTNLRMMNDAMTAAQVAIRFDASGRVTMPAQPAFTAFYNGNPTNSTLAGGGGDITFNATKFNIGSHYSTSTGRFTAPIAGVYQFSASAFGYNNGQLSSGTSAVFTLRVNGTNTHVFSYVYYASTTSYPAFAGTALVSLSAGDYVNMFTNFGIYSDNADIYCHFSGHLVG